MTSVKPNATAADDDAIASGSAAAAARDLDHHSQQTCDDYDTEFDPEILGQAIEAHLDRIMNVRPHQRLSTCTESQALDSVAVTSLDDVTVHGQPITCQHS